MPREHAGIVESRTRQQIRLLLDHEAESSKKVLLNALAASVASQAARGCLKSGSTIKLAVAAIDQATAKLISVWFDQVAPLSRSIEAFAMLSEALELHLGFCRQQVDKAISFTGKPAGGDAPDATERVAVRLFEDICAHLRRQLELHRFSFTQPDPPVTPGKTAQDVRSANKGGRPSAHDWDEMWAEVGTALYVGDLKPKTQAEIERAMLDWVSNRGGDPNVSTIRPKASKLWACIKRTE